LARARNPLFKGFLLTSFHPENGISGWKPFSFLKKTFSPQSREEGKGGNIFSLPFFNPNSHGIEK
jgi:hypothetical protein